MPDITMCLSKDCPNRFTCYRFVAKPDQLQSYSDFHNHCSYYIKATEQEIKDYCGEIEHE